jgi:hypothetical protein
MSTGRRLATWLALAGLVTGGLAAVPSAAVAEPSANLVLHYDFDDDFRTTGVVHDSSPSGLNGTLVNPAAAATTAAPTARGHSRSPAVRAAPPRRRTSRSPTACSRTGPP